MKSMKRIGKLLKKNSVREKFVRGVSKTFRNIKKNKREEMTLLDEQTKFAYECEEDGDRK